MCVARMSLTLYKDGGNTITGLYYIQLYSSTCTGNTCFGNILCRRYKSFDRLFGLVKAVHHKYI